MKLKGSFFLFFPGDDPASSSWFEHCKANDLTPDPLEFIGDHRQLSDTLEGLLPYINHCWHKAATAGIHNIAYETEKHRRRFIELFIHLLGVPFSVLHSVKREYVLTMVCVNAAQNHSLENVQHFLRAF